MVGNIFSMAPYISHYLKDDSAWTEGMCNYSEPDLYVLSCPLSLPISVFLPSLSKGDRQGIQLQEHDRSTNHCLGGAKKGVETKILLEDEKEEGEGEEMR